MKCATKNTTKIKNLQRQNAVLWAVIAAYVTVMLVGCGGSDPGYKKEVGDQFALINEYTTDCMVEVLDRSHWVDEDPEFGNTYCYKVKKLDKDCGDDVFKDTLYVTHDEYIEPGEVSISNEYIEGCPL